MAKSIGIKFDVVFYTVSCEWSNVCVCLFVGVTVLCVGVWGLVRHVKEMDCNLWEF